ncbi:Myosin regulatory light chain 12B [Mactra antiquata]
MSSMKSRRKKGGRVQRLTSNVFAMFDQAQIQEFKEAFNMIDQNRDGYVDRDDLQDIMVSLGKDPSDDYLEKMIAEAPGPINFTMFLTLFGDKLNGTDPEDVIRNAFACFDDKQQGYLPEEYLRECLMTMGDRWSDDMVDDLFLGAPIKEGRFDYQEFTRTLKHGSRDKKDDDVPDFNAQTQKSPPEVAPKPAKE